MFFRLGAGAWRKSVRVAAILSEVCAEKMMREAWKKNYLGKTAVAICLLPRRSIVSSDPRRAAAMQECLRPLVRRSVVYDLGIR